MSRANQTQASPARQAVVRGDRAMPSVSVIIAFLDAVRYIEEAIESVLAQSYRQWELLLVDDGSTDGSTELALRYASEYPDSIHYLEHDGHRNLGVAASRNVAILYSGGEYVAFLDADDVWLPEKLERQVAILETHPEAGMAYGLDLWWYSWTGEPEDRHRDFVHELGVPPDTLIQPPALVAPLFFQQEATIPCPSTVLVRLEALEAVGGFEDKFRGVYGPYEDQAFFAKITLAVPVFASRECWNRYRQHPSSACSVARSNAQEYAARLFFMEWLTRYLSSQDVKDVEIWNGLHRELRRCRHPNASRLLTGGRRSLKQAVGALKARWT